MNEENKMIVEHREVGKLQDSLEIGTPAKGGSIKVYGDFANGEEFKRKVDMAIIVRLYAQSKLEEVNK